MTNTKVDLVAEANDTCSENQHKCEIASSSWTLFIKRSSCL